MIRHQWIAPKHYGELVHGDKFHVDLRVYKTGSRRFSMAFDFYRKNADNQTEKRGEKVFSLDGTEDYFADVTGTTKKIITLPDFFLETLREERNIV